MNGVSIEDFFGPHLRGVQAQSHVAVLPSMLAFQDYHSMIEMKRYMIRFIQFQPAMERLDGILHTRYNEFDSLDRPHSALADGKKASALYTILPSLIWKWTRAVRSSRVSSACGRGQTFPSPVGEGDMVIATLGDMTQNSTWGDNTHPVTIDRGAEGFFSVWGKAGGSKREIRAPGEIHHRH